MTAPATRLQVDYFDGRSARAHRMQMWIENDMLQLSGKDLIRQVPLGEVLWPERTRHGIRLAHFEDGGSVQALDAAAWDAWCRDNSLGESLVVKAQQSWRWSMVAAALLVMVTVMGYWWGLPLAARAIAPLIPVAVDKQVGAAAREAIDAQWLKPSRLSAAEQARWQALFDQALTRHRQASGGAAVQPRLPIQWHFRHGRIGPNALALPDGSIIVTDDLIGLLHDRQDVLLGIIGHELGHITLRHGMRSLIQTGLLGAATSVALGDFSSVLAAAPALLGHMAYSRSHEREADEAAVTFMRHNDIRPSSMTVLFERLAAWRRAEQDGRVPEDEDEDDGHADEGSGRHPDKGTVRRSEPHAGQDDPGSTTDLLGIAFSSHPPDDERIAFFKAADVGP